MGDRSYPSKAQAVTGSSNVLVDGRPILRVDDIGLNGWKAVEGARHVLVNYRRVHRLGDKHTNSGLGTSSNFLLVGDSTKKGDAEEETQHEFGVDIALQKRSIVTPLSIPDRKGNPSSTAIPFSINISSSSASSFRADKTRIEVFDGAELIYSETQYVKCVTVGKHEWIWDSYDSNGIFDTARLRKGNVRVRVRVMKGPEIRQDTQRIIGVPEEVKWVDTRVNRNSNSINTLVRIEFRDGGVSGLPAGNSRPSGLNFQDLRDLAIKGIGVFWSREHIAAEGVVWTMSTQAEATKDSAFKYLALGLNMENKWKGGWNPKGMILGEILALFKKPGAIYNYYDDSPSDQFMHQTAHEFGHIVLLKYQGTKYSWTHKGSSTIFQNIKPIGSGGLTYPAVGEIDLMKYYEEDTQITIQDILSRTTAAEEDARGLLWLARMRIKSQPLQKIASDEVSDNGTSGTFSGSEQE